MKTLIALLLLFTSCATHHIQVGQQQNAPVVIKAVFMSNLNSAGGADVQIYFTNTSGRTINYFTFTVEAYNRVGDPVRCEIRRNTTASLRATGPYQHGRGTTVLNPGQWGTVFYNHSIREIRLKEIIIEYDNRETETIKESDIVYSR